MQSHNERFSFSVFETLPNISHGYFTRDFGSVATADDFPLDTFKKIASNLSIPVSSIKLMDQIHSGDVCLITSASSQISKNVDGLVTKGKGIFLGIKTADCLPLIFYDPLNHTIGACHAGYKGLLADIIPNTLKEMKKIGAEMKNVLVGIGPSICNSCYNIKDERLALFTKKFPTVSEFYETKDGMYFLDLKKIALSILKNEGINEKHVETSPYCTKEHNDLFFSRRVEKEGVFLTGIGMI